MQPLSKSDLWQKMAEYYNEMGPDAWQDEVVPLQISSNKYLAKMYADLIVSQMNDYYACAKHNIASTSNNSPFSIIEIGAGHGKFSFYLLKQLQQALKLHGYAENSLLYIMTDISEKNIQSWKSNPFLKPFVQQKQLKFAKFNATQDEKIVLEDDNKIIDNNFFSKSIFMICNYLFDTLAHDAFQVIDNKLHETRINIHSKTSCKDFFKKAAYDFSNVPVTTDYYEDKNLNKILELYQQKFSNASFLLPIGGVKCISTVKKLTSGPFFLLLADKGTTQLELMEGLENPDISFHGSVSLTVNFHALAQYFLNQHGKVWLMDNKNAEFQIASFCLNNNYSLTNFNWACHRNLTGYTPQDLINLCYSDTDDDDDNGSNNNNSSNKEYNLEELLALLNLSLWDPNIFYDLSDQILEIVENKEITLDQEQSLLVGAKTIWDFSFKLEKSQDIPFALGTLYYALDKYEQAIESFHYSIEWFGENAENMYNLSLCHFAMENHQKAQIYIQKSLEINKSYTPAKELLSELKSPELDKQFASN